MKLKFSRHIFEEYSISNFIKIRPVGALLFYADGQTDGQTGMAKLMVALRNSAKQPNKPEAYHIRGGSLKTQTQFIVSNKRHKTQCVFQEGWPFILPHIPALDFHFLHGLPFSSQKLKSNTSSFAKVRLLDSSLLLQVPQDTWKRKEWIPPHQGQTSRFHFCNRNWVYSFQRACKKRCMIDRQTFYFSKVRLWGLILVREI